MASWDKQPNEGNAPFDAFQVYLNIETDKGFKRTYTETARRVGKSLTLINRWAKQWNWEERLSDYLSVEKAGMMKANVKAEQKRLEDLIARKQKVGKQIEAVAYKALARIVEYMDENPKYVMQVRDFVTLLEFCFKLQEIEIPEYVDSKSGGKGIVALADSIKALAEKTISRAAGAP